MTEESSGSRPSSPGGPDAAGWRELLAVPAQALQRLDGRPVLVTALAVSVVLLLLAVLGPPDARVYAALVCGLVVVMTVLHLLSSRSTRGADGEGGPDNATDLRSRATAKDVSMHAGTGSNWLRVGRRASVDGITMTTGGRVPSPRGSSGRAAGASDGAAQRSDEPRGQ